MNNAPITKLLNVFAYLNALIGISAGFLLIVVGLQDQYSIDPIKIAVGISVIFGGVFGFAILKVICSIADDLTAIRTVMESEDD